MRELKALSLFSSAGIGELEAHGNTIDVVAANELIERRAQCYTFFYPETKMFQGDILEESLQEEILRYSKEQGVNFLLVTPPCQGLSSVGKNKKQNHFIEDRRNFLVLEIFKFIDELNLEYVLIENVPRFLNMYFPYENELLLLEEILKLRYSEHYIVEARILNAKDYGISQSRPRAIIKLYKKGRKWAWPEEQKEISLEDSIGHLPALEAGESSNIRWHYANKAKPSIVLAMKHTPPGTSAFKNEVYYPKKDNGERISGFHNTYKRMRWDRPASARTTYSGSISSHNNVHPGRRQADGTYSDSRVLTLLETFIVSSISPNITFPEWASDAFIRTIIGEAIPPKLLDEICKEIL